MQFQIVLVLRVLSVDSMNLGRVYMNPVSGVNINFLENNITFFIFTFRALVSLAGVLV